MDTSLVKVTRDDHGKELVACTHHVYHDLQYTRDASANSEKNQRCRDVMRPGIWS